MKNIIILFVFYIVTSLAAEAQPGRTVADSLRRDSMNRATLQDYNQMLNQLRITAIRPGANGGNLNAPNAVNYDEAKANPYPNLPDPLTLRSGSKISDVKTWWQKRRPEIVEDFDREILGRMPVNTPKVSWEV